MIYIIYNNIKTVSNNNILLNKLSDLFLNLSSQIVLIYGQFTAFAAIFKITNFFCQRTFWPRYIYNLYLFIA